MALKSSSSTGVMECAGAGPWCADCCAIGATDAADFLLSADASVDLRRREKEETARPFAPLTPKSPPLAL